MTYGTKALKNGKRVGYLHFDSGKQVYLNAAEVKDLEDKIMYWQQLAVERRAYESR